MLSASAPSRSKMRMAASTMLARRCCGVTVTESRFTQAKRARQRRSEAERWRHLPTVGCEPGALWRLNVCWLRSIPCAGSKVKTSKSKSCGFLYLPPERFEQFVSSEPTCVDDHLGHVRPQVSAGRKAAGSHQRVSSLTLLTGMNCVLRWLGLCFSHRSQRGVVRVRKSLHLMFTERC